MSFLTDEQKSLANEIGALLVERGETVAVAEGTTGGLISSALLYVAGASKYYAGGALVYTLNSRIQLADVPAEQAANYQGTTIEMVAYMADSIRKKLGASWGIAEAGLAGPTGGRSGAPPGLTRVGVAGPATRAEIFETGSADREENMAAFLTNAL